MADRITPSVDRNLGAVPPDPVGKPVHLRQHFFGIEQIVPQPRA